MLTVINTLGFPIAVCIGLAFFMYKTIIRLQDENKAREDRLMEIIVTYGDKMGEITSALERLSGDIETLKNI